ncbi:MAG: Gfo/Idh/MocA family oxidoreductase, partial [Actinobacteria bacterium]|nr:Gfo/Idh/MocA family oxidoreductase [Actinomycetota bacterium]
MAYRMIQVGTGGHGKAWCERFLPPNVQDDLLQVVAAVDVNPAALANAQQFLGLRDSQCYTDLTRALDENPADFCSVVVPPAQHETVVDAALAHDLHVLSEKPIADTLTGSVRIAAKVARAGKKMGVTMSHRFDQDKTTLREELRSGRHGPVDYLVCRFTCDCRQYGSWGAFRHDIPDTLRVEGAVHHLDLLAALAGAPCATLCAQTWNPSWGQFKGDSQGLVLLHCANGARAVYEGAKSNAVGLNWWTQEYIRAECERSTPILDHRDLEYFAYDPTQRRRSVRQGGGIPIPFREQPKWANAWLVEQFVRWLDGGPPMATNVEDNLQSVALIFAAIESSRRGQPATCRPSCTPPACRQPLRTGGSE